MRKHIFIITLLLVCGIISGCNLLGWQRFESKEAGFAVDIPGEPKLQKVMVPADMGPLPLYVFSLNKGDGFSYFVSIFESPADLLQVKTVDKALDDARDGALSAVNGQLLRESAISLDGYPGRELAFSTINGQLITKARLFLVDLLLYQIMVTTAKENQDAYNINKFLNSFKLIARKR